MKKFLFLLFCSATLFCKAQTNQSLDTVKAPADYENIFSKPIYSDSLVSSFVIFVKKEVKAHKHLTHTEHVYILDGEGEMRIGKKIVKVKRGDIIPIPKNTIHSLKVISSSPVKLLSVQTPMFDGKDKVMTE